MPLHIHPTSLCACPNNFPDPLNHKPLTLPFINTIKKCLGKPVAAIMTAVYNTNTVPAAITAPINAVMGVVHNPVAYMPPNTSNVIKGENNSDMSESHLSSVAVVTNHKPDVLKVQNEDLALFTIPHDFELRGSRPNQGNLDFPDEL